jgi:hypothetical protein
MFARQETKMLNDEQLTAPAVYTVDEFCKAHRVGKTRLYELWLSGRGPRFFYNGTHRRITAEAAADWRRDMESASRIEAA